MNDGVLSALSLCRKAGALKMGADAAEEALREGAPLAVYASDAAERTVRRLALARGRGAEALPLGRTMDEIQRALGRRFAVAAVADAGLATLVRNKLAAPSPPAV